MLEAGPETLFFIASVSIAILLAPLPSLNEGRGLLKNDLAIVPSNFSLELQCY